MYVKLLKSDWHKKVVLSVCVLFLFSGTIWAQNITVTGRITDKDNIPLPGVGVFVTGSSQGVSTGSDGTFSISVPARGSLTFTMIGMTTQVVSVNNRTRINVTLFENVTQLEDLVVVAYGTQKKENLSGAVSVVNVEKTLESRTISDVGRALQGSTPGLTITTTSGALGGDPTIRLRSNYVSMGQGSANPLILVDNVEVPSLSFVNPNDIESISTLKDAATTAIYGSRAANGAIVITTKKGSKDGRIRVSYNNNFSWGTRTNYPVNNRPDLELDYSWKQQNGLNLGLGNNPTYEYNQIGPVYYNPDMMVKVKEYWDQYGYGNQFGREMVLGRDFDKRPAGGFYFYRGWDMREYLHKHWTPQTSHNLSVSGGNDAVTYNISVGLMNQNGIYKYFHDFFNRMNASSNISVKVNKLVTIRMGNMFTKTNENTPFSWNGDTYDPTYYLYRWFSIFPNGTYKGMETRSGIGELIAAQKNPTTNERWYNRLTLGATLNIASGLTATFDYTYSNDTRARKIVGGYVTGINVFNTFPAGSDLDYWYQTYTSSSYDYARMDSWKTSRNTYNARLMYKKSFGIHNLTAMVGADPEDSESVSHWSRRNLITDYNFPEINLASGDQLVGADHTWWSTVGFFGRVNYEFGTRYLLELNFRRDGSSKFRDGMRWASYPSGSAAWRVSEEKFWTPIKPYVNSLKFRGSYGSVGNQSVPSGLFIASISQTTPSGSGNYWLTGGNRRNYSGVPGLINPDLTWETQTTLDLAVEMRMLKDKLGLMVDWYNKKSTDLITQGEAIPSSVGASAPRVNSGELTTKGIEIELNFNHAFKNGLRINASASFTDYKTVVTKFASTGNPLYTDTYFEGKVLGSIYGYKVERLFQKDDFVYENGKLKTMLLASGRTVNVFKNLAPEYQELYQSGNFRFSPGDVMFKDLNGDGIINYGTRQLNNMGDISVIGNSQPRYQYNFRVGASWYGFDFDMFFQGVGKRNVWATGNMVLPGYYAIEPNYTHQLDYWSEDNPNGFYPRPLNYNQSAQWNYLTNDRYLLNIAYLRCKTITLGYSVPKQILQKVMVNRARVYVTGENLFEFDHLRGAFDPEMNWTSQTENDSRSFGRSYPYRRTFAFGLQIDF